MKRREFITLLGAAAATWPVAGWAALASEASGQRGDYKVQQSERMPRMGILLFAQQDREVVKPCLQELEALGYVDGKTITIEFRDAQGDYERLPELAAELVKLGPDVIFSFGGEQAPIVKQATDSIPIVVVVSNDPVASGLVTSLARPGGNVTGVTYVHDQLAGKTIELLRDAAPSVSRVAILWNPNHTDPEFRETQRAAQALQMQLQSLEVRQPADFEGALQAAARERAEALIVVGSRIIFLHRQRIGDFAAKNRLILVGTPKWLSSVGAALLTYGPNPVELQRRAASYVSKILKGAKPADLPMQQPATFELVLNLKTARALGLEVPPTLIARADEVIE
jgi:putative tryptophan/tyrosine transport system substrate-binding protein